MPITPSYLRQNLYAILDQVIETGVSPEIVRKNRKLIIIGNRKPDLFKRLQKHPDVLRGKPDDIVSIDWSHTWNHDLP